MLLKWVYHCTVCNASVYVALKLQVHTVVLLIVNHLPHPLALKHGFLCSLSLL